MKKRKKIIILISLLTAGVLFVVFLLSYPQKERSTSPLPNHPKNNNMSILKTLIALSNGVMIPIFGLGTWNLTNYQQDKQAVQYAIQHEYRLLDSAQMYGNEKMLGQAIKESEIPREEMFLVSKLNTNQCDYEIAKQTINQMLQNFQTDYLDLCLIHWPVPQKRLEAWKALEEAYKEGKLKAIGVSNFEPKHLDELLNNCEIPPMVNQIELHPAFRQKELLAYCQAKNIKVMAYMPLMAGNCQNNKVIKQLAKKHEATPAQICLRWVYQQGAVAIPKSKNKERIIENTQIESFSLDKEDMDLIDTITERKHDWDPREAE